MVPILSKPIQPEPFRVCPSCRKWLALLPQGQRDDPLVGSLRTYRCRLCGHEVTFASRYPPGALGARDG